MLFADLTGNSWELEDLPAGDDGEMNGVDRSNKDNRPSPREMTLDKKHRRRRPANVSSRERDDCDLDYFGIEEGTSPPVTLDGASRSHRYNWTYKNYRRDAIGLHRIPLLHNCKANAERRICRGKMRFRHSCCPTRIKRCAVTAFFVACSILLSEAFNPPRTTLKTHLGPIRTLHFGGAVQAASKVIEQRQHFQPRYRLGILWSSRPNSYDLDLDAIEEGIIIEQSNAIRSNKKNRSRRKKNESVVKCSTLPTEPTANDNNAKRARRGSRRRNGKSNNLEVDSTTAMPPWLIQFEDEDFSDPQSLYVAGDSDFGGGDSGNESPGMQRLRLALNGIFAHSTSSMTTISVGTAFAPEAIRHFTPGEVNDILDSVRLGSGGNLNLMAGCADFLYLMLTLEEEGVLTSDFLSNERWDDDDVGVTEDVVWDIVLEQRRAREGNGRAEYHSIMTRDVLVAAACHYCDCVRARKAGVYDYVRQAMDASLDMQGWKQLKQNQQLLLPADDTSVVEDSRVTADDNAKSVAIAIRTVGADTQRQRAPIEHFGEESLKIAMDAARLKRAEIMASTSKVSRRRNGNEPNDEAEILRSFLISMSDDWRALVIRSSACLYRLRMVDANREYERQSTGGSLVLSSNTINAARDAFRVYAPLAQRLGMQRLKTELENTAFKLLYPRQFEVASSMYSGDIVEMKSIIRALSSRIEGLLKSDQVFAEQSEVVVTSRLKEPYSLWKKMLRFRAEQLARSKTGTPSASEYKQFTPATLSMKWVPDAIAFRVVLRARRLSPFEEDESVRTREKMLCYYALQLISDVWPASLLNHAKDYIKDPKPNGYQSLHYTATCSVAGEEWPFEVQIRSDEMHRIAEFGVAAHWDYKLQNKTPSLPDKSVTQNNTAILALPSGGSSIGVLAKADTKMEQFPESQLSSTQKSRVASYIEALATSREQIVQNSMFVFLSSTESALDGKIVSIDPGLCTVADVISKYEGDAIDEEMLSGVSNGYQIYKNGLPASLDTPVSNGDVLTLPGDVVEKLLNK